MFLLGFKYGNLEMSNIAATAILLVGTIPFLFFIVASLKTDMQGLVDSSTEQKKNDRRSFDDQIQFAGMKIIGVIATIHSL